MATQKTHPELFVRETRTLRDGKGLDRVVTMPKIYWGSYDFIVNQTDMNAAEILTIADESAEHYQMSWHDYLPEGLAHIDHLLEKRLVAAIIERIATKALCEAFIDGTGRIQKD